MANMRFFPFIGLLLLGNIAVAQDSTLAAIERINALVGPEHSIVLKKKQLIIDGFREGIKVKTDKVNVYDLDPKSVAYSADDAIVSMACFGDMVECVERNLLLDGAKNYRKRVAFGVADAATAELLVAELRRTLQLFHKK